jgi:DNA-binding transcriptional MocR family regulator
MRRMQPLADDGLLYEALATRLADAISSGKVKRGERMPSVRSLSTQYKVSISTAVQAYRHLENLRLIEARPKSGFFAAPPQRALPVPEQASKPSPARFVVPTPVILEYHAALNDKSLVHLGSLQSDPDLFPTQRIAGLIASAARRHAETLGQYAQPYGEERLRRAIARRALENGCNFDAEEVFVTMGCVEALNLCLRAVAKPGDTIALESPVYFVMLQMIESLGMKALEIPTHPRTGMSIDALDLATQKPGAVQAVMVTPSFTNPLGCLMPDANRKALVTMCEARGIPVIEDDIYGDIWFSGSRPLPAKAWDRTGNVLLCSSFSKTLAPGLRIGWLVPGRYTRQIEVLKRIQNICTAPLPQFALAEFMESGGYDHHLRKLRRALHEKLQRFVSVIAESFPEGTKLARPAGGYVLWVELPANVNTVDLFRRAREDGILIAPGAVFTNTGRFQNALRFTFGMTITPKLEQSIARVGALAAEK